MKPKASKGQHDLQLEWMHCALEAWSDGHGLQVVRHACVLAVHSLDMAPAPEPLFHALLLVGLQACPADSLCAAHTCQLQLTSS